MVTWIDDQSVITSDAATSIYLSEPLSEDRINKIIWNIFRELDNVKTPQQLETFLWKILNDVQWLQSQIESLSGKTEEKRWENLMLTNELARLKTTIKEKETQLSKMFLDKLWEKIRRNVIWILTSISVAMGSVGVWYWLVKAFTISPEEQILINEQTQKVRAALEATFNRLWITIDEDYSLSWVIFKRRTEDVAFSERDFLNENDFYQLESIYNGYTLVIAIPFTAPENIIIALKDDTTNVRTEIISPTKTQIESFIESEFQKLEAEKIAKEQEEAKKKADDELKKKQDAETETKKKAEIETENNKIIDTRKKGVISVIETLTWVEDYVLWEPIVFKIERGDDISEISLYPERRLWRLWEDQNWLWTQNSEIMTLSSQISNSELKVGEKFITSLTLNISVIEPHKFEIIIDWYWVGGNEDYKVGFVPDEENLEVFWRDIQIEFFGLVDPLEPNIADEIRKKIWTTLE